MAIANGAVALADPAVAVFPIVAAPTVTPNAGAPFTLMFTPDVVNVMYLV
jgi:hypothetical protein